MASGRSLLLEDPIPLEGILVPEIYAKIGQDYPQRIFARILTEDGDGLPRIVDVTWGRLLQDSAIAAESLLSFGIPRRLKDTSLTVLAILATSSYRYYTYLVGAWLNGWTPLLLSTRNSLPAILHLLSSVKAQGILVDETTNGVEGNLKEIMPDLVILKMHQSSTNLHNGHSADLCYALSRTSGGNFNEVALYMHTSGSQGHPKPVPTTHRHFVETVKIRSAARYSGSSVYAPLPLFHGMGIYAFTRWPIGSGVIPTFVNMQKPMNGNVAIRHLRYLPRAIGFLPPTTLEDMANAEQAEIASLANAELLFYGGAPLKESSGNKLVSQGVSIANAFGMSEISLISILDHPSEDLNDWSYVRFREDIYNLHFLPVEKSSSVCELIVGPGPVCTPAVLNHELGFATNDLWAPHSQRKGLWKHVGRKDGVTVLSTGEKTDNGQLVSLLTQDARIAHALVFGSGKPLNGVIISPRVGISSVDEFSPDLFREEIWDTVINVNRIVPRHSRLIRQMVLVESRSKSFMITDKGTVRVRETLALYESEIDAAYSILDGGTELPSHRESRLSPVQVKSMVREIVKKVCGYPLSDDTDIFDCGADSLHVLQIRAELLPLVKTAASEPNGVVPQSLVYKYPTINQLVSYLLHCIDKREPQPPLEGTRHARIEASICRFSEGFEKVRTAENRRDGLVILMTGSSGSLGSHVLDLLLRRHDVKQVHCLMRGQVSMDRQKKAFRDRSIPLEELQEHETKLKVHFADLSKPDLALSSEVLELIRGEVTHIFHLAWELNFNWPLERFERYHVSGVRHLIDLVCSSRRSSPPKLVFSSSIGAVANYERSHQVPEEAFDDFKVSSSQGYGEAKYVAERLIDSASRMLQFPATIIRCGQLSGSTANGVWTRTEFIPLLFRSSLSLGVFPDTMPPVRWLPVDVAAECFVDLALVKASGLTYYHIENTESTPWPDISKMFLEATRCSMKPVPTKEWLAALERTANTSDNNPISATPAAFLLEFYSHLTAASDTWRTLDTSVASQLSPRMRYGRITPELMDKYIRWVRED